MRKLVSWTLSCTLAITAFMAILPAGMAQASATGQYKGQGQTAEEITRRYKDASITEGGQLYADQPVFTPPYTTPGSISNSAQQDGLKMLNLYRWIAGVDLADIDADYISHAQNAAYVMGVRNRLTSHAGRPDGMDENFYNACYTGSNISYFYLGNTASPQTNITQDAVYSSIQALGSHYDNVDNGYSVGSRTDALSPSKPKYGFGAVTRNGKTYVAMAHTSNSGPIPDYTQPEYVAWPAAGYVPKELVDDNIFWSINLNTQKYDSESPVEVTMTAINSGKTYTFKRDMNHKDIGPWSNNWNLTNDGLMSIGTGGNYRFAIAFRPNDDKLQVGNEYNVRVSGLRSTSGSSLPDITYSTKIFSVEGVANGGGSTPMPTSTQSAAPTITPQPSQTPTPTTNPTPQPSQSPQTPAPTINPTPQPTQAPSYTTGWHQQQDNWYYYDGSKFATGWQKIAGQWYYFNADGVMQTGWLKDGLTTSGTTKWYYLQPSGSMATGWKSINGIWYYLLPSGEMKTGWYQGGRGVWYYLKPSGAMASGWEQISGTWYWFDNSGEMATGTRVIDGKTYRFDASGAWIK